MEKDKYSQIATNNTSKDFKRKEKSVIAQEVATSNQIPHQTIITEDGRSIDLDQMHYYINDKGEHLFDQDGEILATLVKKDLTYGDFVRTYRQSAKQAVLMLLALQSNASPLKKGGVDIAYMADLLFEHMMLRFSEEATAVWEALAALQSSKPEDDFFSLTPDDIKPYTTYKSNEALYHAFKKGCYEIDSMELQWEMLEPDVDGHFRSIPWKDGAEWVGRNIKTGEKAHYDVYPNDLYRALMASSGILHGAHWNRRIARSLKGYARSLYLFCARNKKYTKYNGAIEGRKELTIEQTRYELKIDPNTDGRGIWRRLKEAQEKVNNLPESEFNVSILRVPEKGKIEGFRFDIKSMDDVIDSTAKDVTPDVLQIENKELFETIKTLLGFSNIELTKNEIIKVANVAQENQKTSQDMMLIISELKKRLDNNQVKSSTSGYLISLIQNGIYASLPQKSSNKFNNYPQNTEQDFEALEKQLLDN